MSVIGSYLAMTGGLAAGVQIVRGFVRAAGKLVEREGRAALVEMAGGVVAPARTACHQIVLLGHDVMAVAQDLVGDPDEARALTLRVPRTALAPTSGNGCD